MMRRHSSAARRRHFGGPSTGNAFLIATTITSRSSWIDTKEVRPPESRAYAILNDSEHPISEGVLDAMRSYDVHPVLWSGRDAVTQELAA